MRAAVYIGCAGWSIPKQHADRFPREGTHLSRYAMRLGAVEIDSSFYRPHRPETYARWAASTPAGFRFAVKLPREVTHVHGLVDANEPLERFLREATSLGDRLGPLLVQLPPSLAFDPRVAPGFFESLRARFDGEVACEPRHATWFTPEADALLAGARVARVAADPPAGSPLASRPGGWRGLAYRRLHGAPQTYYSNYDDAALDALASELRAADAPTWCVFDNTALGHATGNALDLAARLAR